MLLVLLVTMLEKADATIVVAGQIVRDVKVGGGSVRQTLQKDTLRLRNGMKKSYIPGDKVNCEFEATNITSDGILTVDIFGGMIKGSDHETELNTHIYHPFHLDVKGVITMADIKGMPLDKILIEHCN